MLHRLPQIAAPCILRGGDGEAEDGAVIAGARRHVRTLVTAWKEGTQQSDFADGGEGDGHKRYWDYGAKFVWVDLNVRMLGAAPCSENIS